MLIPLFIPTSIGNLSAVVAAPEDGLPHGEPVIWFPGGNNPRSRDPVSRDTARMISRRGGAMARIDYPGCGLSGGPRLDADTLAGALNEACDWFREICGSETFAVGGSCRGAKLGLKVAALNPRVERVVAVSTPIRQGHGRRQKPKRRIRAGIAALDPVGSRVTSALTRGSSTADPRDDGWMPSVVAEFEATDARLIFIYGSEDNSYMDLEALLEWDGVPARVAERVEVIARKGAQLYGFKKIGDIGWMTEVLTDLFIEDRAGSDR